MSEPYIGELRAIGFNFAPKGWALCNGQLLPINQNQALFSVIGTTYGGNGTTNFALPNLQSRVALGSGQGPGLQNYVLGQTGGNEGVALTPAQLPVHTHVVSGTMQAGAAADDTNPAGNYPGSGQRNMYSDGPKNATLGTPNFVKGQTASMGSGVPHENHQPYLATYFVIALTGVFPSRG
ncbi:tail fiber protein [Hymenobacter sp. 5317J-9]|uniref:phage tail protein n=1 Tax=Hymenobacter sp. 5317J-9 TaxID=2932250 RepID=UPI001FD665B7|nr:tail fiber protein [Hymenobacter sp. 5317J-9]UOQ96785.1 tail fiber protein [Hymenobacter sp. 5317J-9]